MNNIVCPDGSTFSRDDYSTGLNNNICVCGTSGTGKTRSVIIPNLLELSGNYIVTDPKGFLYRNYKDYFEENGYIVKNLSFTHPERSIHYNPLSFVKNTHDIQRLAYAFVSADQKTNSNKDPFWDEQALFLINSVFSYMLDCERYGIPDSPCNLVSALEHIRNAAERSVIPRQNIIGSTANKNMFVYEATLAHYAKTHGDSFAIRQYRNVLAAPDKTYHTIVTSALSKFSSLETDEATQMLEDNDVNLEDFIENNCIYFVEVSDTDPSMDLLVNIFFTQMMHGLCEYADNHCEKGRLPKDVIFVMDDFPSYKIDNFDKIVNNIRSRGISTIITVQTLQQLDSVYSNGQSIISNCDTMFFMGTNDLNTAGEISHRVNRPKNEILNMKKNTSYILRRGEKTAYIENSDSEQLINSYYNKEEKDLDEFDL